VTCMNRIRLSNFELVRIVAIFLITLHHLTINNLDVCGYNTAYNYYNDGVGGVFLNSMAICGVNLFILISGWFGIKRIWSNIIRLIVDVVIIGLINITICYFLFGYMPSWNDISWTCSYLNNWFILHFIILILCSPIIEQALSNTSSKDLGRALICLSIVVLYFGYYQQVLNPNGYNALNFIYLYIVARWLSMNKDSKWFGHFSTWGLFIWILCGVLQTIVFVTYSVFRHAPNSLHFWSYNAPWVLISSLALFSWFSRLRFSCKAINVFAIGTLGVYLLQSTKPFNLYRGELLSSFSQVLCGGWLGVFLYAVILFLIFDVISIIYTLIYRKVEFYISKLFI